MKILLRLILITSTLIFAKRYTDLSGKVTYYGNHVLHKWSGESNTINGFFSFNEQNNEFTCDIEIPIISFDSKNSSRDSNMLIYTNAIDQPNIKFKSDDLQLDKNKAKVNGTLYFGGKSKNITVELDVITGKDISFSGAFIINLSDYEITRPSLLFKKIDDEMKITFSIIAKTGR